MTLTVVEPELAGFSFPPVPGPDLDGVFRRVLGDGHVPGWRGLLVAPRATLARAQVVDLTSGSVDRAALTELPHPVLRRCGLVVARYPGTAEPGPAGLVVTVRAALVAEAQRVLVAGARYCQDFLASRRSGGRRLSAHPVVAHQVAGAVAAVAALRYADVSAALADPAGRDWLVSSVDDAAAALVKLAGGRSLLAGHLVALRTVLLTVNRVYLGGDPCTR